MKYLRYLWSVCKHKWYVFLECCKLGIPWLGIIHDWSKFLPSEFFPYARYFYGQKTSWTMYNMNEAWLHHQHRNKHHWQRWVLRLDHPEKRELTLYPMPDKYLKEMLADWHGAGRAYGNPDTRGWYLENRGKMQLNHVTMVEIEDRLGLKQEDRL